MTTRGWCVLLALGTTTAAAQPALVEVPFGKSEAEVAPGIAFSPVPKSSEETKIVRADATLLGVPVTKAEYTFWYHRLHEASFEFGPGRFDALEAALTAALGPPERREGKAGARETTWYPAVGLVALFEGKERVRVYCSDRSQKDLQWRDVLQPPLLSAAGAVVGLFLLLFFVASLVTSWCPKCHSFAMKETGRSVDSFTDVSPSPTSVNYRANVSFRYRCAKCGHQKTDRYDGFWSPGPR